MSWGREREPEKKVTNLLRFPLPGPSLVYPSIEHEAHWPTSLRKEGRGPYELRTMVLSEVRWRIPKRRW
jgi:hypothetical protein